MNTITGYEVIRIINRKPLFLSDHFTRFKNTIAAIDQNICVDNISFGSLIYNTIKENNIENGNIKIEACFDTAEKELKYSCRQIAHHYPSSEQYQNGVNTLTYECRRENPHNKIWDQNLRDSVDKFIADNNIFEAIYVSDNHITEGSRSNIFFIKDNELISAPEKDILKGVTRKYIIETAKRCGLTPIEIEIDENLISNFDCAFISGTSPKILPIAKIGSIKYDVENEKLRLLMMKFDEVINQNIN